VPGADNPGRAPKFIGRTAYMYIPQSIDYSSSLSLGGVCTGAMEFASQIYKNAKRVTGRAAPSPALCMCGPGLPHLVPITGMAGHARILFRHALGHDFPPPPDAYWHSMAPGQSIGDSGETDEALIP